MNSYYLPAILLLIGSLNLRFSLLVPNSTANLIRRSLVKGVSDYIIGIIIRALISGFIFGMLLSFMPMIPNHVIYESSSMFMNMFALAVALGVNSVASLLGDLMDSEYATEESRRNEAIKPDVSSRLNFPALIASFVLFLICFLLTT